MVPSISWSRDSSDPKLRSFHLLLHYPYDPMNPQRYLYIPLYPCICPYILAYPPHSVRERNAGYSGKAVSSRSASTGKKLRAT